MTLLGHTYSSTVYCYGLQGQEKELKYYFRNYVTSSKLETIMLKLLKVLKQEF